jgi:glycosyltransferase involved in cell wall biosynthesis
LSQDYPRIEYIIMDGGSTDETAAVVREYAGRLEWYSEKDRGQSHAINKGFRMARGEVVSWLNSDDVILPGAISHAVRAFEQNPRLGAVYGEGYQIDINGNVKGRFPATEPFNLWKLVYLYDYILQQTTYFRRTIFEEIGYLDEDLHWGMDWDLFIRIAKRYPIEYIPVYMGCIREYAAAKSFAGGAKRFRELVRIMRRHSDRRYPPGYVTYGLETYSSMACEWIEKMTPKSMEYLSRQIRWVVRAVSDQIIIRTLRSAQGLYSDGWAGPKMRYMLGPGSGTVLMRGSLPDLGQVLRHQVLHISCSGFEIARVRLPAGEFEFRFAVPGSLRDRPAHFIVRASRWIIPKLWGLSNDFRRLSYTLRVFEWV